MGRPERNVLAQLKSCKAGSSSGPCRTGSLSSRFSTAVDASNNLLSLGFTDLRQAPRILRAYRCVFVDVACAGTLTSK